MTLIGTLTPAAPAGRPTSGATGASTVSAGSASAFDEALNSALTAATPATPAAPRAAADGAATEEAKPRNTRPLRTRLYPSTRATPAFRTRRRLPSRPPALPGSSSASFPRRRRPMGRPQRKLPATTISARAIPQLRMLT